MTDSIAKSDKPKEGEADAKRLPWYRGKFAFVAFGITAYTALLIDPFVGAFLGAALLLLAWTGDIGVFTKGGLARPWQKALLTLAVVATALFELGGVGRDIRTSDLDETGLPRCDSSSFKKLVQNTINTGPLARTGMIEAFDVQTGVDVSSVSSLLGLDDLSQASRKCGHNVLTNRGEVQIGSKFRWVDESKTQYFVEVRQIPTGMADVLLALTAGHKANQQAPNSNSARTPQDQAAARPADNTDQQKLEFEQRRLQEERDRAYDRQMEQRRLENAATIARIREEEARRQSEQRAIQLQEQLKTDQVQSDRDAETQHQTQVAAMTRRIRELDTNIERLETEKARDLRAQRSERDIARPCGRI